MHITRELAQACRWKADATWHPAQESLDTFLFTQLWQLPYPNIALLIPPVMHNVAHSFICQLNTILEKHLTIIRSHLATIRHFGKRWVRNAIANFINAADVVATLPPTAKPICIAAGGPSLNMHLTMLHAMRAHIQVWALSSAVPALLSANIHPDLVVTTDGSHWATHHIRNIAPETLIAMPLTAAHCADIAHRRTLIFHQRFALEQELATSKIDNPIVLRPHASVATSALELTEHSPAQTILLCGLDLGYCSGMLHCRPHAFERIFMPTENRLRTYETATAMRYLAAERFTPHARITLQHRIYRQETQAIISQLSATKSIYQLSGYTHIDNARIIDRRASEALIMSARDASTPPSRDRNTLRPRISYRRRRDALTAIITRYIKKIEDIPHKYAMPPAVRELAYALTGEEYARVWDHTATDEQYRRMQRRMVTTLHALCKY